MDRRHRYGIMIDTETANTLETDGKLDMSCVLPYDIGFAVIDSHGRVYETFSFVNSDIFYDEAELMQSAYYARKIPIYLADIQNGSRIVANTYEIRKTIVDKIKEYNCSFVCAHNARFDVTACNNIQRWTTKSKYRYFFPYGMEVWDTLKMARQVVGTMPTYQKFCENLGLLTKSGKPQLTAEALYKFILQDADFSESHTGLEDVLIEVKILEYCVKRHKKMNKVLYEKKAP